MGNDGDGSLSIMTGTLDRMDQEAPHYKNNGYNNFNTFYFQAASRIYGETRDAPVINCDGRAVALNVGSKNDSCTTYFLPLDKVQRALKIIQNSNDGSVVDIPRGTLQMTPVHKGFDEARRLRLQCEIEELARQTSPSETGILVIASVVPGGPASAHKTPLNVGCVPSQTLGHTIHRISFYTSDQHQICQFSIPLILPHTIHRLTMGQTLGQMLVRHSVSDSWHDDI